MHKQTITFENFDGDTVTKDFYFHLGKADLIRIAANGNLEERIKRIHGAGDNASMLQEFEAIIRMSVGIRSEDGNTFIKTPEAQAMFIFSPAYDELMTSLLTDGEFAARFINSLVPEKLRKELRAEMGAAKTASPQEVLPEATPPWIAEDREPTSTELMSMSKDQLVEAMFRKTRKQ